MLRWAVGVLLITVMTGAVAVGLGMLLSGDGPGLLGAVAVGSVAAWAFEKVGDGNDNGSY